MATDYISREAAIEEIRKATGGRSDTANSQHFVVAVRKIPAADVRPVVKSRWVEIDDYVLCANCGVAEHSPNRNYCHCCGADMRPEPGKETET